MNTVPVFRSGRIRPVLILTFLALASVMLALSASGIAGASSHIVVNSPLDIKQGNDGLCTLREAIIAANTDKVSGGTAGECSAGNGADTITVPAGTYTLTRCDSGNEDASQTGDLDISSDVMIEAVGAVEITMGCTTGRILHVTGGTATIQGVTIRGGNTSSDGGGIRVDPGATLHLAGSTISLNVAEGNGGGIANTGGTVTINNSTLSGNTGSAGGGLWNSGTTAINNLTIANNVAAGAGGGIVNAAVGTVNLQNTILAGNTAASGPDCSGTLSSLDYNLVQNTAGCSLTGQTGNNITGSNPLLGALDDNGGTTPTHALIMGSPAIDAGNPAAPGSGGIACEATDQRGVSRPQRLACDIGAFELENNPPVALDDAYQVDEDNTLSVAAPGVLSNDTDAEDTLTVNLDSVGDPSNGSLIVNGDGSFSYTPAANFNGTDQFTYRATDGFDDSDQATVTITVNPVNDPPVANADSAITAEDTAVTINLVANDTDIDGFIDAGTLLVGTGPVNGSAVNNGDGTVTYTPADNYNGTDSLTYSVKDDLGAPSNEATVTITINAVNDPPVAVDDAYNVDEDDSLTVTAPGVLGNDSDVEQDPLLANLESGSSNGTLTLNSDGSFTYTPERNFDGVDTFTYQATDGFDDSNLATATITVNPDPFIEVTTLSDAGAGSLRAAIDKANALPGADTIIFEINGTGTFTIPLQSSLPVITDPVTIDGTTQQDGKIVLDGSAAENANGLWITAGNSKILGLEIVNFPANGILISDNGGNTIENNVIANNGGDGIRILDVAGNTIVGNDIFGNAGLPIDLDGDGPTPNDEDDADDGANFRQNYPLLFRAVRVPGSSDLNIEGWLDSVDNAPFNIQLFSTPSCDPTAGGGQTLLGTIAVMTDETGDVYFQSQVGPADPADQCVTATATDAAGNTSEFAPGLLISPGNDSWPRAFKINPGGELSPAIVEHSIDLPGQSRWYKFDVQPNSTVIVTLTDLPANYDLTIYKDIAQAFQALDSTEDLLRLGAEFAPDSFSPDSFSPDSFSPDSFSPDSFSPDSFSPDSFSPDSFSPDSFSSAQTRSLIGVSAFPGTAGEGIRVNTWNNTGEFYLRIRGANGVAVPGALFHLEVRRLGDICGPVTPIGTQSTTTAVAGPYKTIILTDMARMTADSQEDKDELLAKLTALAARDEVAGVIVDVGADARVADGNTQADTYPACPYAKNLVAAAIKEIVDAYWAVNPLEYVVLVGEDEVMPFFRHPDNALLANEQNYVPPVRDNTPSQASLKLGYVLSQDAYGAKSEISVKNGTLPLPGLAVGRLVGSVADMTPVLDAYLDQTSNGVTPLTTSPLVTGYDFLEDVARDVQAELEDGTGLSAVSLITPRDRSPLDSASWTADQLRTALLGERHDLIFLAGHFSASSALAADYRTRLLASEVANSTTDLSNVIVYSAGCHAGYNIVDAHGIPLVTREPDWPQAFSQKGATLLGGTGYQYGDTDFIEYSERLYLEFSRQLRRQGPVSVGQALVAAKQKYLSETPQLRGLHEKAYLEATIFGLPMLSVDLSPGQIPGDDTSIVGTPIPFTTNPGQTLGLSYADITVQPSLTDHTVVLTDVIDGSQISASYLTGSNGFVTNPAEPTLPLEVRNVTVPQAVLRGIGLRGTSYTDIPNITPLTGAPTTELRGVHTPFLADYFYPVRLAYPNYFDGLSDPDLANTTTRLSVTPAQYRSTDPTSSLSTLRRFGDLEFRLYYSDNFTDTVPVLSGPPTISRVSASTSGNTVDFSIQIVANPAAGVQEAWVTYTLCDENETCDGLWRSLDLMQNNSDTTLWEETLTLTGSPGEHVRFIVQAVNGVGLVDTATNQGRFFIPEAAADTVPTSLVFNTPLPSSGAYGTSKTFSATLISSDPVGGRIVTFRIGGVSRSAITDASGIATGTLPLLGFPGQTEVRAAFAGSADLGASSATAPFEIVKQDTVLTLDPQNATGAPGDPDLLVATLTDVTGRRLIERTVFFVVSGAGGSFSTAVITDFLGRAPLGDLPLPVGDYIVDAYFSGTIPLSGGETVTLEDVRYNPTSTSGTLTLNNPPDCSNADGDVAFIWPPNKDLYPVNVLGVTDPDGDPINITIDAIFQDEPVGKGDNSPDGFGIGTATALVRAERDGNGDGRVYHIYFTAMDTQGATCAGEILIPIVPHDQSGEVEAIDGGALFDSTMPE